MVSRLKNGYIFLDSQGEFLYIPSPKKQCLINQFKTHHPHYSKYPRFIYIYRDGRDVAVSYYQYETRVGNFRGSFEQFIRTKMNRHFGSWHAHVLKAMEFSRANPQRVLLLQYGRMLENTFESVKEMVIFCGIIANEARLKKAVKLCSFERLKKVESEYGSEDEYSPNMKFFHEGRSGQWKIYFSNAQLKSSYDREGDALRELNYID